MSDLAKPQIFHVRPGITPQQKEAIKQLVLDAMDDGIRAAANMIRASKITNPDWSLDQLADAI